MDEEYLRQDRLARGWSSSHIDRQAATEAWRQAPGGRGAEGERSLRLLATQRENSLIEEAARMTQRVGIPRHRTGPSTNSHQNPPRLNALYSEHYRMLERDLDRPAIYEPRTVDNADPAKGTPR